MPIFTRSIRPPEPELPNGNDPVTAAPGTVGPPTCIPVTPTASSSTTQAPRAGGPQRSARQRGPGGRRSGRHRTGTARSRSSPTPRGCASTSTATCSRRCRPTWSTPPPTLNADWLTNPDDAIYTSWEEFAKQLFWDYQAVGETFVLATARYSTGWPARFHVVPPYLVNVEMDAGFRRYTIGSLDVTRDILHLRYKSSVDDAHGHGPLEAGSARLVAAEVLARYGTKLAAGGGIPTSVLEHPDELTADQSALLKAQWVQARLSSIGEPAVLSGGVTWKPTQLNPRDMALLELSQFNEARIANLLGVPPFLVGLPSGGDSLTYANVSAIFDYHWRASLRPKAQTVMSGLSGWALPRGTNVELNRDEYVQPGPYERAQYYQIMVAMKAMSVQEVRDAERLDQTVPVDLAEGVLR